MPPHHPLKNDKKFNQMNKSEQADYISELEHEFIAYNPDFSDLQKATTNPIVKSNSIIFPVYNLKKKVGTLNNCKMIIQINVQKEI
jgi:hypothetical protein